MGSIILWQGLSEKIMMQNETDNEIPIVTKQMLLILGYVSRMERHISNEIFKYIHKCWIFKKNKDGY